MVQAVAGSSPVAHPSGLQTFALRRPCSLVCEARIAHCVLALLGFAPEGALLRLIFRLRSLRGIGNQRSQIRSAHEAPVRSRWHALGASRAALALILGSVLAAKESHASPFQNVAKPHGCRALGARPCIKDPIRRLAGASVVSSS